MDYEREKPRTKETTNKLANLISSLNLGSEEMPTEKYVRLAQQEIVDAKCNMVEFGGFGMEVENSISIIFE